MYKCCTESLRCLQRQRVHRKWSSAMYKCSGELRARDPSKIYCRWSTVMYKWCGESLRGVEPSRIHRVV